MSPSRSAKCGWTTTAAWTCAASRSSASGARLAGGAPGLGGGRCMRAGQAQATCFVHPPDCWLPCLPRPTPQPKPPQRAAILHLHHCAPAHTARRHCRPPFARRRLRPLIAQRRLRPHTARRRLRRRRRPQPGAVRGAVTRLGERRRQLPAHPAPAGAGEPGGAGGPRCGAGAGVSAVLPPGELGLAAVPAGVGSAWALHKRPQHTHCLADPCAPVPRSLYEVWLVSELADRSMAEAMAAGWFLQKGTQVHDMVRRRAGWLTGWLAGFGAGGACRIRLLRAPRAPGALASACRARRLAHALHLRPAPAAHGPAVPAGRGARAGAPAQVGW